MRSASCADAGAHEMDDVQINPCPSAPALPASPACFPAPSDPAAPRGKATSPLGSPSQQQAELLPSFFPSFLPPSGLFQGLQPSPSQLRGHIWEAFPCHKQRNLGLGKGESCFPVAPQQAGLPGKGAAAGARLRWPEQGDLPWEPGGWLVAEGGMPARYLQEGHPGFHPCVLGS